MLSSPPSSSDTTSIQSSPKVIMEFDPEWLETILKRHARENSIARIVKADSNSVVAKGDNYASDVTRVKIEVFLGSGRKTTRSVIIKTLPVTELRAKHLTSFGVFKKEIIMYTSVLPCMVKLMEEVGDVEEPMWVQCIEYRAYDRIVLEDLKELGYRMADRRKGLNFEQAALVMNRLGKFHAMSVALKERGQLNPQDFGKSFFEMNYELFDVFYNKALETLRTVIDTIWPEEEKFYSEALKQYEGRLFGVMMDLIKQDDSRFNVLNHSDPWVNNIMFKSTEGSEGGDPISLRFIDFQLSNYNSYGLDLQYFLTTSLRTDVRKTRVPDLLQKYQESLSKNLKKFNCSVQEVPTIEDIENEMKRLSLYSISLAITLLPYMKTDPEDVPDMEDALKKLEANEEVAVQQNLYLGKAYTETLKTILRSNWENGDLHN